MTEKEVSDLLYKKFGRVYCDTCRHDMFNEDEEGCEQCHRKNIGWAVSRSDCDLLAKQICRGATIDIPDNQTIEIDLRDDRELIGHGRLTGACIHDIEVAREYRRKGFATQIIRVLVSLGGRWLWCDQTNTPAVKLYEKSGFKIAAAEDGFYKMCLWPRMKESGAGSRGTDDAETGNQTDMVCNVQGAGSCRGDRL